MVIRLILLLGLVTSIGGCTNLFFHPMAPQVFDPADAGIEYQEVEFVAEDGVTLRGWFLPSRIPDPPATVLLLYGNAQNKSTHIASVHWLPEYGYNVLLFDYRGYGESQGRPSLEGMHLDIDAALGYLLSRPEPSSQRIIIFGQSLGGALALTAMAASPSQSLVKGIVVEGGFSGFRAIAREKLSDFWLTWPLAWPLSFTVSDRYRPVDAVSGISPIPLLLVYSNADQVVPARHGEILFEAARPPKELWKLDGVPHISAFLDPERRSALVRLIGKWLEDAPDSVPAGQ